MGQLPHGDDDRASVNEEIFDDMLDKIMGDGSTWQYEQAVHIASDMWDAAGHTGPPPSDYVPKERRRHMTGGA